MLDSLYIKNYRNLEELKIQSLCQVNLIAGKNNTGKSTILEAISIYATRGSLANIFGLLEQRGEYSRRNEGENLTSIEESSVQSLSSLFSNRIARFSKEEGICIGKINAEGNTDENVYLQFVKYQDKMDTDATLNNSTTRYLKRVILEDSENSEDHLIGFSVSSNNSSALQPCNRPLSSYISSYSSLNLPIDQHQLIGTRNIDREINGTLFDNIALSEKEQYVVEALKIIEPLTERIAFIGTSLRERTAVIKLSNTQKVLPLSSMGDGINRILTIILALVNCDKGYLLIDEFENGLHYSVQEKLWKVIFKLAKDLDIQVFASTHSNDCIASFESVLNEENNTISGKLIRLDNVNGQILETEFSAHELDIANAQNIEIR
ncbi:hypothetical protein AwDysgo_05900 [Bacteroidales bacterium]|nr:hypothetical protein AwDysgo_05900 [Bacteroidales bacterium]